MQAAPGELLPDWPRLMHCFRTPQLTINLPGGVQYCAVPQTVSGTARGRAVADGVAAFGTTSAELLHSTCVQHRSRPQPHTPHPLAAGHSNCNNPFTHAIRMQVGAPLRPVTVRDAIGDLPAIENGHSVEEMEYVSGPVSKLGGHAAAQHIVLVGQRACRQHSGRTAWSMLDRLARTTANNAWHCHPPRDCAGVVLPALRARRLHAADRPHLQADERAEPGALPVSCRQHNTCAQLALAPEQGWKPKL